MVPVLFALLTQSAAVDTLPAAGVIAGVVTDGSHRPVQRAIVSVMPGGREIITNAQGEFTFTSRAPGLHVVSVRALGYRHRLQQVELAVGTGWRGRIELTLPVQQLSEVETRVNAWKPAEYAGTSRYDGFFQRKRLGFGTHLSRDEIDRFAAIHFTQVLQRVPGFRVSYNPPGSAQPTTVKIARCAESNPPKVAVYVDGIRYRSGPGELSQGYGIRIDGRGRGQGGGKQNIEAFAELLDNINPRDLEMVEVYRGTSQIPAAFDRDVCAVIAVWTRWNRG